MFVSATLLLEKPLRLSLDPEIANLCLCLCLPLEYRRVVLARGRNSWGMELDVEGKQDEEEEERMMYFGLTRHKHS
ncbi:hypothetical protein NQZ68_007516 [Dissostichus eleginoides]|nr:hypothetical protein NQZ68_007516 [Dissostichus eleginoides]